MPTFAELSEIDPTQWLHQARGWDALGRELADQAGRVRSAFARLAGGWTGDDARSALARGDRLHASLAGAAQRSSAAADLLGRHAGAVLAAQKRMLDAVAGADPFATRVTDEGLVVPAPTAPPPPFGAAPAGLAVYLRDAERIGAEVVAALQDAARSDRETSDALRVLAAAYDGSAPGGPAPRPPAPGTAPSRVRSWWDALSPAGRAELVAAQPDVIGSLDGVPARDRDRANRLRLDAERTLVLRRRMQLRRGADRDEPARLDEMLGGIDAIEARLRAGDPSAFLLAFDTEGAGHAIVAAGDPDRAQHVVTYVPGTGARLGTLGLDLHRADATVAAARAADPAAGTAAVTWLGYDAPPDLAHAVTAEPAERGAAALVRFQEGLRATHAGARAHHTLLGHSYGSTVAGHAARHGGLQTDELVLVGSPGAGAARAADLAPDPAHVWATVAGNDPINDLARVDLMGVSQPWQQHVRLAHGVDPTAPAFGARVFASAPGSPLPGPDDPATPYDDSTVVAAHGQYWEPGSPSWVAIGRIAVGRRDVAG